MKITWSPKRLCFLRRTVFALVVTSLSAGCGTGVGNPATSPPTNTTESHSNVTADGALTQGTNNTNPANTQNSTKGTNSTNHNTNSSTAPAAGSTAVGSGTNHVASGQASSTTSAQLQLENVQIGDKSVLFTTTHGNMRLAFSDPHIENGNPNKFVVTLVNIAPGKYAVNKTTRLQTHWATSMTLVQDGQNLIAQFDLLPTVVRFTSAIGAGQMALYTFQ